MLKQLLFPAKPDGTATSAMLLIARIVFGILLMNHGIQKWTNFQELSAVFPDPLAFVYLVVFILMYIIGPGKFAVDRWIRKALFQKARK